MDIQQIKEAQNYPKISELNKNELFLFSMDIVKKAFLRVNQETTDELIEVTTKDERQGNQETYGRWQRVFWR